MIKVFHCFNTIVVGSGAAGLNAALRLHDFGQKDVAIITEGLQKGTSRNTGSDKQTYYKLNLADDTQDSVQDLAETLFAGGAMDGDLALVEASLSARSFYNLVEIGVPFPHNRWGEYVGYKTDHDPLARATSAGPLTSRFMVEKLLEQVQAREIEILENYQVMVILTDEKRKKAVGLLALNLGQLADPTERLVAISCTNIIYATGGPAGIYSRSVYPTSQVGATGIALEAGVWGKNLTESQYGIASLDFRWNLSGTYQQVLPRYISTEEDGSDAREFLNAYFPNPTAMLRAIFLKGYQWPFDPRKIADYGSSLIDLLVYHETAVKGRRVYLDYRSNPTWRGADLNFAWLESESRDYLENSDALFGTPIDRLAKMNPLAIKLYQDNGIDLHHELLEIAVCAQHNNGGLKGNLWWESNLKHFFPVGEVNGSHGIYRPGGSALNSGQVGGLRAAQFIAQSYKERPLTRDELVAVTKKTIREKQDLVTGLIQGIGGRSTVQEMRDQIGSLLDQSGAHIRSLNVVRKAIDTIRAMRSGFLEQTTLASVEELPRALQNYDLLITAETYLFAIKDYIDRGGKSRGSFLVYDSAGELPLQMLPEQFRYSLAGSLLADEIQLVRFQAGDLKSKWRPVRPIPQRDNWFETVWSQFRQGI